MANLYGRLQGYTNDGRPAAGEATRIGHGSIQSKLETWDGSVRTTLEPNGDFAVLIGPKNGTGMLVMTGNVNDGERGARVEPSSVVEEVR